MLTVPKVSTAGFDAKGLLAIEVLEDLQRNVLATEQPSQRNITRISALIFKARVSNQHHLNRWFIDSVSEVVRSVSADFNARHPDPANSDTLLADCLSSINLLIKYIYYSAVFIIDGKESNSLFTVGVKAMREQLLQPLISNLVAAIVKLTRSIELGGSTDTLCHAKPVLDTIRACGWNQVTIIKERDGIALKQFHGNNQNDFFSYQFEEPYKAVLRNLVRVLPHKSPLQPLIAQIAHEHKILAYLAPYSEQVIMNSVEGESILQVVKEVESSLVEMIDEQHDDEMRAVVELFRKVEQKPNTSDQFVSGKQFLAQKDYTAEFPIQPFKILASMFRAFLIQHRPKPLNYPSLLHFKARYGAYIKDILDDQEDIKLAYDQALEVIINSDPNLGATFVRTLASATAEVDSIIELLAFLHQPKLVSEYGAHLLTVLGDAVNPFKQESIIEHQCQILEKLKSRSSTVDQQKIGELLQLCEVFHRGLKGEDIVITVPIFINTDVEIIKVADLPEQLRSGHSGENIILNFGYSIVEFKQHKLILTTAQLVVLSLIDQGLPIEILQRPSPALNKAIVALKQTGLVHQDAQVLWRVNDEWVPREGKKTSVLIDR